MMMVSKLDCRVLGMKDDLNMLLDDDLSDATDAAAADLADEFGFDVDYAHKLLQ